MRTTSTTATATTIITTAVSPIRFLSTPDRIRPCQDDTATLTRSAVVTSTPANRSWADSGHVQVRVAVVDDHELRLAGSCVSFRGARRRGGVAVDRCARSDRTERSNHRVHPGGRGRSVADGFRSSRHSRADRGRPHRFVTLGCLRSCPRGSRHSRSEARGRRTAVRRGLSAAMALRARAARARARSRRGRRGS